MSGWCSLMACSSSKAFCSIRSCMILLPPNILLRGLFPPSLAPSLAPPFSQSISCWGSLLANPPTKQLRALVVARYVLYPEAYVRVEALTVEVDVVDRHALASLLTWQDIVGNLLWESHGNFFIPSALP